MLVPNPMWKHSTVPLLAKWNRALQEGLRKRLADEMPARPSMPLHDGGRDRQETGEPWGEECRGHWVLRASSRTRPSVVDINVQPILDPNATFTAAMPGQPIDFYHALAAIWPFTAE
ncbi:MAG: ssDNA-binding protein [Enterocloster sp.]